MTKLSPGTVDWKPIPIDRRGDYVQVDRVKFVDPNGPDLDIAEFICPSIFTVLDPEFHEALTKLIADKLAKEATR